MTPSSADTQSAAPTPSRRWFRFRWTLLAMTCVVACGWLAMAIQANKDRSRDPLCLIASQSEWPKTIHELLQDAERRRIKVEKIEVLCIEKWMGSEEYYWRTNFSTEMLGLMTTRWTLSPVNQEHAMACRFVQRLPSEWKLAGQADDYEFFISANWLAGEKGHLFLVMHDKVQGLLVVRYYFNF